MLFISPLRAERPLPPVNPLIYSWSGMIPCWRIYIFTCSIVLRVMFSMKLWEGSVLVLTGLWLCNFGVNKCFRFNWSCLLRRESLRASVNQSHIVQYSFHHFIKAKMIKVTLFWTLPSPWIPRPHLGLDAPNLWLAQEAFSEGYYS